MTGPLPAGAGVRGLPLEFHLDGDWGLKSDDDRIVHDREFRRLTVARCSP